MSAEQVIEFLATLKKVNITAGVDAGWGFDALIGRRTRDHDDLDVVVPADSVLVLCELLEGERIRSRT